MSESDYDCDDFDGEPDDDDYGEPVGSCDNCGVNLYHDDDEYLCDQCLYMAYLNRAIRRDGKGTT